MKNVSLKGAAIAGAMAALFATGAAHAEEKADKAA